MIVSQMEFRILCIFLEGKPPELINIYFHSCSIHHDFASTPILRNTLETLVYINNSLLLTSLVQGLSLVNIRFIIQGNDGHIGIYSAGWPLELQLHICS